MLKSLLALGLAVFSSHSLAAVYYCEGTVVQASMDAALQSVVEDFTKQFDCKIADTCVINFDEVKYHVTWAEPCELSAAAFNDPNGSTFICQNGACMPFGFSFPSASYTE